MLQKTCEFCGQPFLAQRSSARFCSSNCRVGAHRRANQTCGHVATPATRRKTETVVLKGTTMQAAKLHAADHTLLVSTTYECAREFSRRSVVEPEPLKSSFSSIAAQIIDALRGEGL